MSDGHSGYTGVEPAGLGVDATTGSEAYQAAWYAKLVRYAQCDPNIASVNLFRLVDEPDLAVWQSGVFFRDYVPKASAAALRAALAASGGTCTGKAVTWAPGSTAAKVAAKPAKKPAKKPVKKPAKKVAVPKKR